MEGMDINDSFNVFHQTLCATIDHHALETERKISYKMQSRDPWIMKGIITSLNKQK